MTYQEQYDKLTRAYIAGEMDPLDPCGCGIGNLLDKRSFWSCARELSEDFRQGTKSFGAQSAQAEELIISKGYTLEEIINLESCFLNAILDNGGELDAWQGKEAGFLEVLPPNPTIKDENALFIALIKMLDELKEIHISKGEVIDSPPILEKRQLQLT